MNKIFKFGLILILCVLITISAKRATAQCAQCAAAVATNAKSGDTTTNGLNKGILFLLAAPYLAVGAVGFIWYKKFRRKNVSLDIRHERLHLN